MSIEKAIFKNGSTTYYFSSRFFPKTVRQDVFKLYGFVRVTDNYVDAQPQNLKEFKILSDIWYEAIDDKTFSVQHDNTDSLNERMVKNMLQLTRKYGIDPVWVEAFLASMQADVDKKRYESLDGSLWYVYGSAEVIGLMMAKILGLPQKALVYAALQGRAMQWINFIRDIEEDNGLGRCYFPREDLQAFGLKDLSRKTAAANQDQFRAFMEFQLKRYRDWQHEARHGFVYIPKSLRVPLETAADMYDWTARQIRHNPQIVFEKQVKPSRYRVTRTGIINMYKK